MMDAHPGDVSEEQLQILHTGVNNAIQLLPEIDIVACYYLRKMVTQHKSVKDEIERRSAILDSCHSKEFQSLRWETGELLWRGLLANVGLWYVVLVPIALVFIFAEALKNGMKRLFCLPDAELPHVRHLRLAR